MIKKLPIGIQTFEKIIEGNYCYVDKTPLIARLVDQGEYYFLSRPRRFGKSLLLDTISQAFMGRKDLFKGLFLEDNWDWSKNTLLSVLILPKVFYLHGNCWMSPYRTILKSCLQNISMGWTKIKSGNGITDTIFLPSRFIIPLTCFYI